MKQDRASATAGLIALSTAFLARDPRYGFLVSQEAERACRWIVEAASPRGATLVRMCRLPWFRRVAGWLERWTLPGIQIHYALRKLYLEEVARRALREGVDQVVVLGAGFDTLALRLHAEFPAVAFLEVDHPATQRVKRTALERRRACGPNLRFLAVDLTRRSLEEALLAFPTYRSSARTLFLMEGVLMYLSGEEVRRAFAAIRAVSGKESLTAFTSMEPDTRGRLRFANASPLVTAWLDRKGEPFRWGIQREELPAFLQGLGFELCEVMGPGDFRRRYLDPRKLERTPLAVGEYAAVAQVY